MSVFKHLSDAFSGKIYHWNETNNIIVNEIWQKIEKLEVPTHKMIFEQLFVSSSSVIEDLMEIGPNNSNTKKIINIDIKKINIEQFRQLHSILLSFFIFIFYTTNPFLKKDLDKILFEVIEEKDLAKGFLKALCKVDKEKINMDFINNKTWDYFVDITHFGNKNNLGQLVYFSMIVLQNYNYAAENIKQKLNRF